MLVLLTEICSGLLLLRLGVGQCCLGKDEHALSARHHDVVDERDDLVHSLLLVDDVLDKRVHFAIGEGVELDGKRM